MRSRSCCCRWQCSSSRAAYSSPMVAVGLMYFETYASRPFVFWFTLLILIFLKPVLKASELPIILPLSGSSRSSDRNLFCSLFCDRAGNSVLRVLLAARFMSTFGWSTCFWVFLSIRRDPFFESSNPVFAPSPSRIGPNLSIISLCFRNVLLNCTIKGSASSGNIS